MNNLQIYSAKTKCLSKFPQNRPSQPSQTPFTPPLGDRLSYSLFVSDEVMPESFSLYSPTWVLLYRVDFVVLSNWYTWGVVCCLCITSWDTHSLQDSEWWVSKPMVWMTGSTAIVCVSQSVIIKCISLPVISVNVRVLGCLRWNHFISDHKKKVSRTVCWLTIKQISISKCNGHFFILTHTNIIENEYNR